MVAVLEMALAWRCQTAELRHAAATDPLTGLANRAGFWSRYQRTTSGTAAESVGVLCIDLDRFKPVNDTYGHAVGDGLLIEVSDRLRRIVRPGDLVARLGGDEFTVVVHDLEERQISRIADRIVEELCRPFTVGGHRVGIGASVGVAVAPVDRFDADSLLDAADRALYDAKHSGRNRWVRSDHNGPADGRG
jgi:diguanylate cyclase (GGDEF)-like protein